MNNFKGIEYPRYKSQPNSKIKYSNNDSKYLEPRPSLSIKKKLIQKKNLNWL